jgi:enoyl-CoA hydratase
MSFRHLEVARDGGVVTVAISNPPRHTLTAKGVEELGALVASLEADPSARVLVLTGGGEGVFIAHYEVGELASAAERQSAGPGEPSERTQRLHPFHQICLRLERLPAVTIAALNGSAAGGGCELSLACDFRLMADGPYRYGLPETGVGIIPGAGGTQRMARLLGTARALDLVLHGTLVTPAQALALGLVHRVYPAAEFRAEVARFAANLASRAPIALAAAKRAIRAGAEEPRLEDGLAIEQEEFGRTMRSKDAAGAMRAWLEGKTYQWQGK